MAKRTNKTSHVLNLLTAPTEEEKEEKQEGEKAKAGAEPEKVPVFQEQPDSKSHSLPRITVVDEGSENEEISEKIRENLVSELEKEEPSFKQSREEPEELKASDTDNKEEPEKPEEPKENVKKEPEATFPELDDEEYCYVNVMEAIIRRQQPDPTQYGVCGCKRCRADVMALVLTYLPSKYMIVQKDSVVPLLNYYENKYKVAILTALIKACMKVKENPRHKAALKKQE